MIQCFYQFVSLVTFSSHWLSAAILYCLSNVGQSINVGNPSPFLAVVCCDGIAVLYTQLPSYFQ